MPPLATEIRPRAPEIVQPGDTFYNYCLWEFTPRTDPTGKWRASSILLHSFDLEAIGPEGDELLACFRAAVKPLHTVWGIKRAAEQISWEFYIYDYRRRERERSMSAVLEALRPMVRCDIQPDERIHYFMFSIDIDRDLMTGQRDLDTIHMYIGNVGSQVSSGISYALTPRSSSLENFYFFFDPAQHYEDIAGKLLCSGHFASEEIPLEEILWPELVRCRTICIANKKRNDCIYYSGLDIDQTIYALERLRWPDAHLSYLCRHRGKLDHLLFDVGVDFSVTDGRLEIAKSAYYGAF